MPGRLSILVAVWLLAGCQGSLGRGVRAYEEARYPDAVAEFRRAEPELSRLSRREQARYALYRGLSHLALGDSAAAGYWLGTVKRWADSEPALLSAEQHGRLQAAWRSMGLMPGEQLR